MYICMYAFSHRSNLLLSLCHPMNLNVKFKLSSQSPESKALSLMCLKSCLGLAERTLSRWGRLGRLFSDGQPLRDVSSGKKM